jgi:diacylglycerol kinase (ATP)
MVGCGLDAEVVRRVHSRRSGHIHHSSYARPIWDAIRHYRYPQLRVISTEPSKESLPTSKDGTRAVAPERNATLSPDGSPCPLEAIDQTNSQDAFPEEVTEVTRLARWVFVVNLPRYAGGLQFAPHALGTDGRLDVCTFRQGSLWHGLRYFIGVATGSHHRWADYQHRQVQQVRIECEEPIPYQCDGDPGGFLPVDIRILPGRLRMIASPTWVDRPEFARTTASTFARDPLS